MAPIHMKERDVKRIVNRGQGKSINLKILQIYEACKIFQSHLEVALFN